MQEQILEEVAISQEKILFSFIKPFLANGIYKDVPIVNCFPSSLHQCINSFLEEKDAMQEMKNKVLAFSRNQHNSNVVLSRQLQFYNHVINSKK